MRFKVSKNGYKVLKLFFLIYRENQKAQNLMQILNQLKSDKKVIKNFFSQTLVNSKKVVKLN
jgi:hypothetical protein